MHIYIILTALFHYSVFKKVTQFSICFLGEIKSEVSDRALSRGGGLNIYDLQVCGDTLLVPY